MKNKKNEKPTLKVTHFLIEDVISASGVDADYNGARGIFNFDWLNPQYDSGADYSGANGVFDPSW